MADPFSELDQILQAVFNLAPVRNGEYALPPIRRLEIALKNYHSESDKVAFDQLVSAIKAVVPYIEGWRIDFEPIKATINSFAQRYQLDIDWNDIPFSSDKYLGLFSHDASPIDFSFIDFANNNIEELIDTLNQCLRQKGFATLLKEYIEKNPHYLFNIITKSETYFLEIAKTRLSLFLTDEQIIRAIIYYLPDPELLETHSNPNQFVEETMRKWNEALKFGRSISNALNSKDAQEAAQDNVFFSRYHSDRDNNRRQHGEQASTEDAEQIPPHSSGRGLGR
ncbi:MAG: hypothetical protein ACRCXC_02305 [Legionella sp.]